MIKFSFIKESFLYTIGNALPILASVILLPFYVNYLSPTNYVALSFYIGISLLFQILFSFAFEQYYGVAYTELKHNSERVKILNGSIFTYLFIQGLIIVLISSLIGKALLEIIFQEDIPVVFFPYGFLSVLTGLLNALFKVSVSTYIYSQKSTIFFLSNFINFLFTIIISLSGLFLFPDSLIGPVYGRLFSGIIIVIMNYIFLKNTIRWQFEWTLVKDILSKTWALFAYNIVIWITGNIDRYFLKSYIDVNDLAAYDLIMKCFIGIEFIQNGLSMAIISRVFDIWKQENKISFSVQPNKYFNTFILLTTAAILVFNLILPFFIQIIIKDEKYYTAFEYIGIIGLSYILRSVSYPYYFALIYSKKTIKLLQIYLITTLVQVASYYFFIPVYGLIAAILISGFIKLLIVLLSHFYTTNIVQQNEINYLKWYGIPLLTSILSIVLFYLFRSNYIFNNIFQVIIFLLISWIVYKKEIKHFLFSNRYFQNLLNHK